jgi:hypothetical protein
MGKTSKGGVGKVYEARAPRSCAFPLLQQAKGMIMQNWEKALHKFLAKWKSRRDMIGAVLVGSYAVGNPSKHSDIDIHLVLSDAVKWRERGNKYIDGFLIEYFANPLRQLKKYQIDELKGGRKTDIRMFATGKIIFEKTGEVAQFQHESKKLMSKKFKKTSKFWVETVKYTLWDQLDDMRDAADDKSSDFLYLYYIQLETLLVVYSRYLGAEITARAKLQKYFNDKRFRDRYGIPEFPDKIFERQFLLCMNKPAFSKLERLTKYVLDKLGGFNIDGWKFRSRVEP